MALYGTNVPPFQDPGISIDCMGNSTYYHVFDNGKEDSYPTDEYNQQDTANIASSTGNGGNCHHGQNPTQNKLKGIAYLAYLA